MDTAILWRRLDCPGHESAQVSMQDSVGRLSGSAVFIYGQQPCRLDYLIVCDSEWRTLSARVTGWLGSELVTIEILVDSDQRWQLNGTECPEVVGCLDIDLNFSPSTNLLPVRRLQLDAGQEAKVRAAWLRFPSFKLERLDQVYRRIDDETYRYESAGGSFVTEIKVNSAGFVTSYPNFWEAEATS